MLDVIQAHLEAIYGIRCEYRASDFLVDSESARALGASGQSREELLVHEGDGELELALYVDPVVLQRVSSVDPAQALELDISGFCEIAEGVSHFVYMVESALRERRVSLLELEVQAEVDKFVICALLRWGSGRARTWGLALLGLLFDRVHFRSAMSEHERWRYVHSSRIAKAYCRRLVPLLDAGDLGRVLSELRHGYRLGAEAKLHYFGRS